MAVTYLFLFYPSSLLWGRPLRSAGRCPSRAYIFLRGVALVVAALAVSCCCVQCSVVGVLSCVVVLLFWLLTLKYMWFVWLLLLFCMFLVRWLMLVFLVLLPFVDIALGGRLLLDICFWLVCFLMSMLLGFSMLLLFE